VDLDPVGLAKAETGERGQHAVLAPDQHRRAVAGVAERDGGAHDFFLLALGEHDARGLARTCSMIASSAPAVGSSRPDRRARSGSGR
jgi:hypothetical protein